LVISLGSEEERDDWIFKIKNLLESLMNSQVSFHSIAVEDHISSLDLKSSQAIAPSSSGLSCLGITIVKESKLMKLQENQPILLSNSSSESDSLLNEIAVNVQQKCKLVDDVFPGN
jgi:hypothetical protein